MNHLYPFFVLVAVSFGLNQEIESETSVSSTSVQVAEPLDYLVEVYAPTDATVIFPDVEEKIGRFDVIDHNDRFSIPSETTPGMSSWKRRYSIESIQTGKSIIPEQKIEIRLKGQQQFVITDSIEVTVESVLENRPDPLKFRDIKGLIDSEVPEEKSSTWIWWAVSSAGAVTVVAFVIAFFTSRKSWMMPDAWAINELRSISTNSTNSDEVYGMVIRTLRQYLDYRYGLDANAAKRNLISSIEKLNALNPDNSIDISGSFSEILNKAEAAKFAGQAAEQHQLNADINAAIEFIQQCERSIQNPAIESEVR